MSVGTRIKEARKRARLTQAELGAAIGVAKSTVTGYEKGTSSPKEETLFLLMAALDIDANFLFQDEMQKERPTTETGSGPDKATIELATKLQQLDAEALRLLDAHADLLLKRQQESQD